MLCSGYGVTPGERIKWLVHKFWGGLSKNFSRLFSSSYFFLLFFTVQNTTMSNIDEWAKAYRRHFPTFKFYLYNLKAQDRRRIKTRLTLWGAVSHYWQSNFILLGLTILHRDQSVESFFSNNCTHMVTTKPIAEALSEDAAQKNDILCNALKLGIKVWSLQRTSPAFCQKCTHS